MDNVKIYYVEVENHRRYFALSLLMVARTMLHRMVNRIVSGKESYPNDASDLS